jgi:ribosome maturation protein Sdo1
LICSEGKIENKKKERRKEEKKKKKEEVETSDEECVDVQGKPHIPKVKDRFVLISSSSVCV